MPKVKLAEFAARINARDIVPSVADRSEIRPCTCGDVNCLGWRLVAKGHA